ncbi:FAD:protein FMN transferase [Flavitalea sp.]|nr:FAD:protein FMN transferase [Flavitalea sp.]
MKFFLAAFFFNCFFATTAQTLRTRTTKLMGARFDITIVAKDSITAEQYIDSCIAEIRRIEYLISDWIDTTQVGRINKNAGIKPVIVDKELLQLTQRAISLSKLTNGAFDISFAAMERIWIFDGSMTVKPTSEQVRKAKEKVGYRNIIIDTLNSTILLKEKGMKIGFGALGEGYAADRCRDIMLKKGIRAGIVNGSGDMNTWGTQPDGSPWNIGITNPFQKNKLYAVVPLKEGAVVTSGSYEKYAEINGKRYSHIINPLTGYPATGLISVTVFGPDAEMANGFSTSIMVLGKGKGMKLLERFPEYSCIMISENGKFYKSKNLNLDEYMIKE